MRSLSLRHQISWCNCSICRREWKNLKWDTNSHSCGSGIYTWCILSPVVSAYHTTFIFYWFWNDCLLSDRQALLRHWHYYRRILVTSRLLIFPCEHLGVCGIFRVWLLLVQGTLLAFSLCNMVEIRLLFLSPVWMVWQILQVTPRLGTLKDFPFYQLFCEDGKLNGNFIYI